MYTWVCICRRGIGAKVHCPNQNFYANFYPKFHKRINFIEKESTFFNFKIYIEYVIYFILYLLEKCALSGIKLIFLSKCGDCDQKLLTAVCFMTWRSVQDYIITQILFILKIML